MYDVVIPTFRRAGKLLRLLASCDKADLRGVRLYAYFDNGDAKAAESVRDYVAAGNLKNITDGNFQTKVLYAEHRAFGIWNIHLSSMASDGMFYLCDDTVVSGDAFQVAIATLERGFSGGDGVVGLCMDNLPRKSNHEGAMGLIGATFADRFPNRQCFCPDYFSFHADVELTMFARSLKRFAYCEQAKIMHYHPTYYPRETDQTHRIQRDIRSRIDVRVQKRRQRLHLLWGRDFRLVREAGT